MIHADTDDMQLFHCAAQRNKTSARLRVIPVKSRRENAHIHTHTLRTTQCVCEPNMSPDVNESERVGSDVDSSSSATTAAGRFLATGGALNELFFVQHLEQQYQQQQQQQLEHQQLIQLQQLQQEQLQQQQQYEQLMQLQHITNSGFWLDDSYAALTADDLPYAMVIRSFRFGHIFKCANHVAHVQLSSQPTMIYAMLRITFQSIQRAPQAIGARSAESACVR